MKGEKIVLFQYIAFLFSKTEVQHFKTPARLLVPGIRIRDPSKKTDKMGSKLGKTDKGS